LTFMYTPLIDQKRYGPALTVAMALAVAAGGVIKAQTTAPAIGASLAAAPSLPQGATSGTGAAAGAATTGAIPLELAVPDSPASMMLGVSPTEIARPTTPAELAVSLASAAEGSPDLIPSNYALQVTPYWMRYNRLALMDYLNPGVVQSMAQTLSVSFAIARTGAGIPEDTTGVGFGVNVALSAGHASTAFHAALTEIKVTQLTYLGMRTAIRSLKRDLSDANAAYAKTHIEPKGTPTADEANAFQKLAAGFGSLTTLVNKAIEDSVSATTVQDDPELEKHQAQVIDELKKRLQPVYDAALSPTTYPLAPLSDAATRLLLLRAAPGDGADARADINFVTAGVALERIIDSMQAMETGERASIEAQSTSIQAADQLRRGFLFAVAGATATHIPDTAFTDAIVARWGVWATPAWRFDRRPIEVLGVVKLIHRPFDEAANLVDIGARVVQQFRALTWSAEYLQRLEKDASDSSLTSQRLTANFEFKIRDQMFLTAAFGKDFADPRASQPKGGLISLLGINFGFGKKPSIPIPGMPPDSPES
jgi:hypothetical protein